MHPRELCLLMLGTGDFALPTFLRLLDEGLRVEALFTQPDKPQGRKQEIIPSAIKGEAMRRGVPVIQPRSINEPESLEIVRSFTPDLLVTAAYGQILSADVLAIPRFGGINLHGSLLPAYRGAAPVARAIQNGEIVTGVTVIQMSPRLDAGGMMAVAETPIDPDETSGELESRLANLGAPLVVEAISQIAEGRASRLPQDRSLVTRAPKLTKEEGLIDWSRPALAVHNLVRAMQPWPTAFTNWHPASSGSEREPQRLIIHKTVLGRIASGEPGEVLEASGGKLLVGVGGGSVSIIRLQVPGKRVLSPDEFLRGYRIQPGDRFG